MTSKIPELGAKGSMPPMKQKFPRKKKNKTLQSPYENALKKFIELNDFDKDAAKEIMDLYLESNDEQVRESILLYWISSRGLAERIARPLFGIGSTKYKRLLDLQIVKKKPGGRKPNWVYLIINQ
jgi:hypothetical protein